MVGDAVGASVSIASSVLSISARNDEVVSNCLGAYERPEGKIHSPGHKTRVEFGNLAWHVCFLNKCFIAKTKGSANSTLCFVKAMGACYSLIGK